MKHLKSILFTVWLFACAFFFIYSLIQVDYSEKKFWWGAWPAITVISFLAFVGSIVWFTKSNKKLQ